MTAELWHKTDIHVIYKAREGPWRKAKAYAIIKEICLGQH